MGMQGYLATVTSISENLVLSQITNKGAWCGGVRYKIGNTTDCFKWGDGPEAGQILTWGNWISTPVQEPNNGNVSDRLYENYIEINADNNTFEWNDLPETGNHTITGFFVEFGNSAPGNSDQGSASVATASIVVTAQSFSYPVTISSDQNKVTVTAPSSITAGDSFEATILSKTDYEFLNANDITVTINSTTIDISSYFNAATGKLTIPGILMNGPITIRVSDPTLKWYTTNKTDLKEFLSADNWDTIDKNDFQKLKAEWDALGAVKQASVANSLKAEGSTYDTALKITQKEQSRKNILGTIGIFVFTLFAQIICHQLVGLENTKELYPLIVHLLLIIFLVVFLKRTWLVAVSSVFSAYLCRQIPKWFASTGEVIFQTRSVFFIIYIPTMVLTFFFLKKYVATPAGRMMNQSKKSCLLFGAVPFFLLYFRLCLHYLYRLAV